MKNEHKNILIIAEDKPQPMRHKKLGKHDSESTVTIVTKEKFLPYERPIIEKLFSR